MISDQCDNEISTGNKDTKKERMNEGKNKLKERDNEQRGKTKRKKEREADNENWKLIF